MFFGAITANPDVSNWSTSSVTSMSGMFTNAVSFDQDLGNWDVSALKGALFMLSGAKLSLENYESLLIDWDAQSLQSGVYFHGGNSVYCSDLAAAARANMIASDLWTISDGGQQCLPDDPMIAPDLTPQSDTGVFNNDDITTDNTPDFFVECTATNSLITLYTNHPGGNTAVGTYNCVGVGIETAGTITPLVPEQNGAGMSGISPSLEIQVLSESGEIIFIDEFEPISWDVSLQINVIDNGQGFQQVTQPDDEVVKTVWQINDLAELEGSHVFDRCNAFPGGDVDTIEEINNNYLAQLNVEQQQDFSGDREGFAPFVNDSDGDGSTCNSEETDLQRVTRYQLNVQNSKLMTPDPESFIPENQCVESYPSSGYSESGDTYLHDKDIYVSCEVAKLCLYESTRISDAFNNMLSQSNPEDPGCANFIVNMHELTGLLYFESTDLFGRTEIAVNEAREDLSISSAPGSESNGLCANDKWYVTSSFVYDETFNTSNALRDVNSLLHYQVSDSGGVIEQDFEWAENGNILELCTPENSTVSVIGIRSIQDVITAITIHFGESDGFAEIELGLLP
jgi:surface protein